MPFTTFETQVARIAPAAETSDVQSIVTIYCRLESGSAELKSGMTGYARIYTGSRPIGAIVLHRLLRFVRMEFWW